MATIPQYTPDDVCRVDFVRRERGGPVTFCVAVLYDTRDPVTGETLTLETPVMGPEAAAKLGLTLDNMIPGLAEDIVGQISEIPQLKEELVRLSQEAESRGRHVEEVEQQREELASTLEATTLNLQTAQERLTSEITCHEETRQVEGARFRTEQSKVERFTSSLMDARLLLSMVPSKTLEELRKVASAKVGREIIEETMDYLNTGIRPQEEAKE